MSINKLELEPAILTIFGITGDLARRYLLPAMYQLAHNNLLPTTFKIVGVTRQALTTADIIKSFQKSLETAGIKYIPSTLAKLEASLAVVSMDITDKDEYVRLKTELDAIEDNVGQCLHRLFYLSIPSTVYGPIVTRLGEHGLNHGCQHGSTDSRLLIEKPFGYDLRSAEDLIKDLSHSFTEDQIYRIDHYLAKETVQNILTFRANNPLFQAVWNNGHISKIVITAAEAIGIEGRSTFYEPIGALRDIIQSHLLQIAALVTMDMPSRLSAESIHAARADLLNVLQPPKPDEMVTKTIRGQYDSYRQETNNPDSSTETFAAIEFEINNDTWRGVPLVVQTGKKLVHKNSEVMIAFKSSVGHKTTNYLTFRLQPNEGVALDLVIKRPGFEAETEPVKMEFDYHGLEAEHPDAYERVLVDAMRGDKTLFATSDEVLASWRAVQPILDAWQHEQVPLHTYTSGSAGPDAADKLVAKS